MPRQRRQTNVANPQGYSTPTASVVAAVVLCTLIVWTGLPGDVQGQDWLNKARNAVRQSTREVTKAVERVDPKAKIMQAFQSSPALQRQVAKVKYSVAEITELVNEAGLKYADAEQVWGPTRQIAAGKSPIEFLSGNDGVRKSAYSFVRDGQTYSLIELKGMYVPVDVERGVLPLDDRLDEIMFAACARSVAPQMKGEFFDRLNKIAARCRTSSKVVSTFTDEGQNAFSQMRKYRVAGYTAIEVLDPAVMAATGGIGLVEIESCINDLDQLVDSFQVISNDITKATGRVGDTIALSKKKSIDVSTMGQLPSGLTTLGKSVGQLAMPFETFRAEVKPYLAASRTLEAFDSIGAVRAVGEVLVSVDASTADAVRGIRDYGGNFESFASELSAEAKSRSQAVRAMVQGELSKRNLENARFAETVSGIYLSAGTLASDLQMDIPKLKMLAGLSEQKMARTEEYSKVDALQALGAIEDYSKYREGVNPASLKEELAQLVVAAGDRAWLGNAKPEALLGSIGQLGQVAEDEPDVSWQSIARILEETNAINADSRRNNYLVIGIGSSLVLLATALIWLRIRRSSAATGDEEVPFSAPTA